MKKTLYLLVALAVTLWASACQQRDPITNESAAVVRICNESMNIYRFGGRLYVDTKPFNTQSAELLDESVTPEQACPMVGANVG